MRGRLINPFKVRLAQLDTQATASVPDGSGKYAAGYDDDFREPVLVSNGTDDRLGTMNRRERIVTLEAQIEPEAMFQLSQVASGASLDSRISLILHFRDLERLDMINTATGMPRINNGDRLCSIHTRDGTLVQAIPTPPGLYVVRVEPMAFGFGGKRNLLLLAFDERATGIAGGV